MKEGSTYNVSKPRKILLIGESGCGKTCLSMNFPAPFFTDWDGNLSTGIQLHPDKRFWFDSVESDDAGKPIPVDRQWERGEAILKANGARPEIKTIIDDGLSRMCNLLQHHLTRIGGEMERSVTVGGIKCMSKSLWQPFAEHMRNRIRLATSYGKLYVLTAHIKIDQNDLTEIKEQVPNIQGQMLNEIVSWHTDYLQCDVEPDSKSKTGVSYILRTAPTTRIKLKNSLGLPPKLVVSPDSVEFKAMLDKLNGSSAAVPVPMAIMPAAIALPTSK